MSTKDKILTYIRGKKSVEGSELLKYLGISRQALNKHLKELIKDGKITKEGRTRGVKYHYAKLKQEITQKFKKEYLLRGLEEDAVFKNIDMRLKLNKALQENVLGITRYAFTEILNNAIEHSKSRKCLIETALDSYKYGFKVRDYGIGIFHSIAAKFNLHDESDAVGELIKGKKTTSPKRHTGEGVFFTSKSADIVSFRSHKINLIFNNVKNDIFVEEGKFIRGTEVIFKIGINSKRKLEKIFNFYAPREFGFKFEKTKVWVKLFQREYSSRSEAKRLLAGLDKFKVIVLDFQGVGSIGQGFADEIFRVFQGEHPDILIKIERLSPLLKPMINHVVDNKI